MLRTSSHRIRAMALILLALASLSISWPAGAAIQAQLGELCFKETGFCISGRIRAYWERNGGLPVFGYPITSQRTETVEGTWTGPVQWFERDRLEDHTNEGTGILAGRLGARWLELQGRPWQTLPRAPGPGGPSSCSFFAETGHLLCGRFRTYWQRNGGLERFGYPITEAFNEEIEGRTYLVQYFERRRMEYHPEHAGTRYEVLLGLLGRDVYQRQANAWFFNPRLPTRRSRQPPIMSGPHSASSTAFSSGPRSRTRSTCSSTMVATGSCAPRTRSSPRRR